MCENIGMQLKTSQLNSFLTSALVVFLRKEKKRKLPNLSLLLSRRESRQLSQVLHRGRQLFLFFALDATTVSLEVMHGCFTPPVQDLKNVGKNVAEIGRLPNVLEGPLHFVGTRCDPLCSSRSENETRF